MGYFSLAQMFDCFGIFATGVNNLLQSNPKFTPELLATRSLQQYMNWTLFKDTGYRGILGDPAQLTDGGDLQSYGINFPYCVFLIFLKGIYHFFLRRIEFGNEFYR